MAIDLPAEKVAFIAYNIGVFESVQKFGSLITSGRITGATDPARVAELLAETYAFYDAEMLSPFWHWFRNSCHSCWVSSTGISSF